jgi:hypothetical protein
MDTVQQWGGYTGKITHMDTRTGAGVGNHPTDATRRASNTRAGWVTQKQTLAHGSTGACSVEEEVWLRRATKGKMAACRVLRTHRVEKMTGSVKQPYV